MARTKKSIPDNEGIAESKLNPMSEPLPTHMYHGTPASNLESILSNGIRPRGKSLSNWPDQPSKNNFVYLTTNQGFEHGLFHSSDQKAVVFEVALADLRKAQVYPDEDFVADYLARQSKCRETYHDLLPSVQAAIRLYKKAWQDSILLMGSLAHIGKIPVNCISRYCTVDFSLRPTLAFNTEMPVSSITQYQMVRRKNKQNTRWYFGDTEELYEASFSKEFLKKCKRRDRKNVEQQLNFWLAESLDRTGIEVVSVR